MQPRKLTQLSLLDLPLSPALPPPETAIAPAKALDYPQELLGDSERVDATVDRTYQHCPDSPQVWVYFPGGHCERLPVVAGWSDRRYVAAACTARASVFE